MLNAPHAESWSTRAYRPGDETALIALFNTVFGRPITAAHWQWKLKQWPSPVENVWLAVDANNRPVFHYAGVPIRYHLPGGDDLVMLSVDAMAAPEFQRQGILRRVVPYIFETWRAAGIPFTLGLPNEKWAHTPELGWQPLFLLQWLIRPLRPDHLLAQHFHLPWPGRATPMSSLWNRWWDRRLQPDPAIQVRPITAAGPELDTHWQQCAGDAPLSTVRDSQWVQWRYLDSPQRRYHVLQANRGSEAAGYVAYRVSDEGGRSVATIAEVQTRRDDTNARHALLYAVLQEIQANGVALAAALVVPGTPLFRTLRRAGFRPGWGSFLVHVVPLATTLSLELFRNPGNWNLTGGDFDVV